MRITKNYCHYWIHHPHFVLSMRFHQNWYICHSLFKTSKKTWPNRWQVPTLTGVNIDRRQKLQKTIVTTDFIALDLCRVQNFIKIEAFTAFPPNLWPERWHVPTLASVKNYKKLLSSVNSAPSNCSLCKISWKMVNLIPRSPFPFLKISYFKLRYCWEETRISNIRNKSS